MVTITTCAFLIDDLAPPAKEMQLNCFLQTLTLRNLCESLLAFSSARLTSGITKIASLREGFVMRVAGTGIVVEDKDVVATVVARGGVAGGMSTGLYSVSSMSSSATRVLPAEVGADITKLRREAPWASTQSFCQAYNVGNRCKPRPGCMYASIKGCGSPRLRRRMSKAGIAGDLNKEGVGVVAETEAEAVVEVSETNDLVEAAEEDEEEEVVE